MLEAERVLHGELDLVGEDPCKHGVLVAADAENKPIDAGRSERIPRECHGLELAAALPGHESVRTRAEEGDGPVGLVQERLGVSALLIGGERFVQDGLGERNEVKGELPCARIEPTPPQPQCVRIQRHHVLDTVLGPRDESQVGIGVDPPGEDEVIGRQRLPIVPGQAAPQSIGGLHHPVR